MPNRLVGNPKMKEGIELYSGRWVAMIRGQVIGQGGTPEQARLAALTSRSKETPQVVYVPTKNPLVFPPILYKIADLVPSDIPVYLVGGAVRDALLQRKIHDLDFILPENAIKISRQIANRLGGAFFPLDQEFDTGRIILTSEEGGRFTLDLAARRGQDLESDLRGRDFTINAMAVDVRKAQEILDPLGGGVDLLNKHLRACSPTAISNDPVRILRAIRQAAFFGFHILPETRSLMRSAVPLLGNISPERMRDELFRLLDGPRVATSIRALDLLGALRYVLPELETLKGVDQSPPHQNDVWNHTISVVQKLEVVLSALTPDYNPDAAASLATGILVLKLGRFRHLIGDHFEKQLNIDRPLRPLLFLAALYHDVGKPDTRQAGEEGGFHFYGHEETGASIVSRRGQLLRLSNLEIERLAVIVRGHLRPMLLEKDGGLPSRRATYRFYRDLGESGIDICILALADFLGTYGVSLPEENWEHLLEVVRHLLGEWWEHPQETITPPAVINGDDVMRELGIPPGRRVGEILEAIREAQAVGNIKSKEDALALARELLAG